MNTRDRKIANCEFDYWIIFIYYSDGKESEIVLFDKNSTWRAYITDAKPFEEVKHEISRNLGLKETDSHKDRFVDFALNINSPENTQLNAQASCIRLKDKDTFTPLSSKVSFQWFPKDEAKNLLQDKVDLIAFNHLFSGDGFWEHLDTEKA